MTDRIPRVGVLGFFHESNTFAPGSVDVQLVRSRALDGTALLDEHADASTALAGFIQAGRRQPWQLVPLRYIELVPSAPLDAEAGALVIRLLREALQAGGPFDALLVGLHGAAVAEGEHDLDGAILEMIRDVAGDTVVVGVTLDLHANVSERMVRAADIVCGYRTNPHVDARERGAEVGELVARALATGRRPVSSIVQVPAVMGILAQGTDDEPWRSFESVAARHRAAPGIHSISMFQGFPWADVPDVGMSVVVVSDPSIDDGARARAELAETMWAHRAEFSSMPDTPSTAIARAPRGSTTLVLDVGDNIGAGGTGESTALLASAIAAGRTSTVGIVRDPGTAAAAAAAGVGAEIDVRLGRPQLHARATVLALSDGRYEDAGPTHVGHRYFDAGPSAALALDSGPCVVVTSRAILPSSTEQLRHLGLEPRDFEIVIAKGVHSPLAGYLPHVDQVVHADTDGATGNDFTRLRYRHRPRPLYPLDADRSSSLTKEKSR